MEEFKTISLLLSHQMKIYNELLGLENAKTRILLEGKAQELDTILNEEQSLIMKSENLENERRALQDEKGFGEMSLRQIIDRYPESREAGLDRQFCELGRLIAKLKKANGLNKRLVEARLATMRRFSQENGGETNRLTYNKEGILI